jgi:glutathione peroxidase
MRKTSGSAHDFTFNGLNGTQLPLRQFAGKALLVVNTASGCGFTPQYDELQALWERRRNEGLVILGVPSNDFGNQEPGTAEIIRAFCAARNVTFPMADKVHVLGPEAHPFYKWAAAQTGIIGRPRWNFYKYLIDRDGNLAGWFSSLTKPNALSIRKAIEKALS